MNIIVAYQRKDNGIGFENNLPWQISDDMKYFKKMTTQKQVEDSNTFENLVIMGRKTWESIPEKHRSLPERICYVVSRNNSKEFKEKVESYDNTFLVNNLDTIVAYVTNIPYTNVWLIGGSELYKRMIDSFSLCNIYVTEIFTNPKEEYQCDTFFPEIDLNKYSLTSVGEIYKSKCKKTGKDVYLRHLVYSDDEYITSSDLVWVSPEKQYLKTLEEIMNTGILTNDRTGVGTKSVFGKRFEYNLADGFPALTTKRIFLRGVFEELMMYLKGITDNNYLQEKGINIWNGNTSREFLDTRGLTHYPEGDMGETYGFNFRHFGGEYKDCKTVYEQGNGFDQLNYVIDLIKNDPNSRRMIINLWNPNTLAKAALPSCLCQYQFYVNTEKNTLNLQIYIRSSDFFLANNWNTCTGAYLVAMLCNLNGINLTPGILTVVTGDTHIYTSHFDGVNENLQRYPRPMPRLFIEEKKDNIEDFEWNDMKLIGYFPYPNIKASMAV